MTNVDTLGLIMEVRGYLNWQLRKWTQIAILSYFLYTAI